jgi:hypothetical protein
MIDPEKAALVKAATVILQRYSRIASDTLCVGGHYCANCRGTLRAITVPVKEIEALAKALQWPVPPRKREEPLEGLESRKASAEALGGSSPTKREGGDEEDKPTAALEPMQNLLRSVRSAAHSRLRS